MWRLTRTLNGTGCNGMGECHGEQNHATNVWDWRWNRWHWTGNACWVVMEEESMEGGRTSSNGWEEPESSHDFLYINRVALPILHPPTITHRNLSWPFFIVRSYQTRALSLNGVFTLSYAPQLPSSSLLSLFFFMILHCWYLENTTHEWLVPFEPCSTAGPSVFFFIPSSSVHLLVNANATYCAVVKMKTMAGQVILVTVTTSQWKNTVYSIDNASNIVLLLLLGSTTADSLVFRSNLNRPKWYHIYRPFLPQFFFLAMLPWPVDRVYLQCLPPAHVERHNSWLKMLITMPHS